MHYVKHVEYLQQYSLLLTFENGETKSIDLAPYLNGEIFEPLKNMSYFKTVRVHPDLDTIYWENDADFSPDFLFEASTSISTLRKVA